MRRLLHLSVLLAMAAAASEKSGDPAASDRGNSDNMQERLRRAKAAEKRLAEAMMSEDIPTVKSILEERMLNIDVARVKSDFLLHHAAAYRKLEILKELLKAGANPNLKDVHHRTPLSYAARDGYHDVAVALIDANANVNGTGSASPLFLAAMHGHAHVVKLLLSRGADHSQRASDGSTPLILAARDGHTPVVRLLLDKDKSLIDEKDVHGFTALVYACQDGQTEVAEELIERGADVNSKSVSGWTALHKASQHGHEDIVELLLEASADPTAKNFLGHDPLFMTMCSVWNPFSSAGWCPIFGIPGMRSYNHAVVDLLKKAVEHHRAESSHRMIIDRFYHVVEELGITTEFKTIAQRLGVRKKKDLEYVLETDLEDITSKLATVEKRKFLAALRAVHDEL